MQLSLLPHVVVSWPSFSPRCFVLSRSAPFLLPVASNGVLCAPWPLHRLPPFPPSQRPSSKPVPWFMFPAPPLRPATPQEQASCRSQSERGRAFWQRQQRLVAPGASCGCPLPSASLGSSSCAASKPRPAPDMRAAAREPGRASCGGGPGGPRLLAEPADGGEQVRRSVPVGERPQEQASGYTCACPKRRRTGRPPVVLPMGPPPAVLSMKYVGPTIYLGGDICRIHDIFQSCRPRLRNMSELA